MDIFGFFTGVLYYYTHSVLVVLLSLLLYGFRPRWCFLAACCFGFTFGAGHQWWVRDQGMPSQEVIRHAHLAGVIASIPNQTPQQTKFEFDLDTLNDQSVNARVQLGCYRDCPILHAGERWDLYAKLHTVHSLNNPGGFDYKTHLATKHIHWTGYVQQNTMRLLQRRSRFWQMITLREDLALHLAHLVPDVAALGIVQALTIGVTTNISQDAWTLFRCTGTTHLMVISGAHIGLVAGMIFKIIYFVWSRSQRLCLRYPAQRAASIVAIVSGLAYALVAGFGAPAERASVAAVFIFLRYLGQRQFGTWQAWRYALLAVLLTEPHTVLTPGFYLSFMAVAILLTMNQRIRSHGVRKSIWIQLSCMVGLLPFTLFWFSYGAVNGLIANMIAIPWVSFVIIPWAFVSLGLGQYWIWIPKLLQIAITGLLYFLHWVDGFNWMNLTLTYANPVLPIAAILGLGMYLFLPIWRLFPIAATLVLTAFYPKHPYVAEQEFQAKILDVGQGLSVLIQTHSHTLIYDTGGQNFQGSDMGKLVIIPYLQHIGLSHLNTIVISHPDLDHRGGLVSLEALFPAPELIVDDPQFYHRGTSCHTHSDWIWDGVRFHFFQMHSNATTKNNHSCILQISNQSGQILLTGDIEKSAEQALIQTYGPHLQSTILVVPHHGSNTSSSLSFLQTVTPKYAILSYGFDNRYHFPHAKVMNRYHDLHIPTIATAEHGMITLSFQKNTWKLVANS